ncbi:hypothetical protein FOZ63_015719, partial [Perkinsus olseni]
AADDDDYDTPDFGSINDDDHDAAEILNLDDERCGNMTAPHDDDEEEGEGVYYNNDGAIVPLHDVNYTYGDTVDITRDDGGDAILMRGRSGANRMRYNTLFTLSSLGLSSDDSNINTVKRSKSMGPYNNKRSGSSLIRDTTMYHNQTTTAGGGGGVLVADDSIEELAARQLASSESTHEAYTRHVEDEREQARLIM